MGVAGEGVAGQDRVAAVRGELAVRLVGERDLVEPAATFEQERPARRPEGDVAGLGQAGRAGVVGERSAGRAA
jgi:hypothetical protein